MSYKIDLSGNKLNRWTVIRFDRGQRWICRCDCGTEKSVDGSSLRRGTSMGCADCAPHKGSRRTHGGSGSRLYNIWCGIKARCSNPDDAAYPRYGGRGIRICLEWSGSFATFQAWAERTGYASDLTIDRKNNDGHYEPDNCRWATYAEQNRNYSRNKPILHEGRYILIGDLAKEHGLPSDVVKNRVRRYGWPLERALTTPVQSREKREPWKDAGMSRSTWHRRGRPRAVTVRVALANIDAAAPVAPPRPADPLANGAVS